MRDTSSEAPGRRTHVASGTALATTHVQQLARAIWPCLSEGCFAEAVDTLAEAGPSCAALSRKKDGRPMPPRPLTSVMCQMGSRMSPCTGRRSTARPQTSLKLHSASPDLSDREVNHRKHLTPRRRAMPESQVDSSQSSSSASPREHTQLATESPRGWRACLYEVSIS